MAHMIHHSSRATTKRQSSSSSCIDPNPDNTLTDRMNSLLATSGEGYVLSLCPSTQYVITAPIQFAAPNQEISTQGYPTDDTRATLVVDGPVENNQGHTTAVDGTCANCSGVKLRHIQVNGTRLGAPPLPGGGNIEMGGSNSDQLIEYVHSYDPRGWTCLHLAEGAYSCNNITVQNNDIGPAGSSQFQQWADGISDSCQNAVVRNNMINNPTDGGIVLFGSPGTQVYNNTIWVETQTLLGGINMVDYSPWFGNYTDTVVHNNTIIGAFSSETPEAGETNGPAVEEIMIKIGIAIGPRIWFGPQYGWNASHNGTVYENRLMGAFGFGMAISGAANFTVQDNVLVGNTSFIGTNGPNCTTTEFMPKPAAFVFDTNNTQNMNVQSEFETVPTADGLTCVMPPQGGDYWPFGTNPGNSTGSSSSPQPSGSQSSGGGTSAGAKAGIAFGVILGIAAFFVGTFYLRRWYVRHLANKRLYDSSKRSMPPGYAKSMEELPSGW